MPIETAQSTAGIENNNNNDERLTGINFTVVILVRVNEQLFKIICTVS